MKQILLTTTISLTATFGSILSATAPAALALKDTQSIATQPLAAQKTASETPYEATDPKYQTGNQKTKVEEVSQSKGHRRFRRRSFRRRGFGRRGFGRRGFRRRGFGRRGFGHRH
ncbi:hypothetical protein S7335_1575 [Synechococcus sp. PCC 7335]|uniref:hypothetical protein n=1 Tax=Synechococcus sp. (strain ATCC 29403 / PCC 7335) TaxID=91464 RepID=UPI00017EC350|nr:hypothetical protein [Synechococcus sp. PCC 7335]EDX83878.1 hypothetical protein S7335_1575 [Synechococcus sp. PCC 7335]